MRWTTGLMLLALPAALAAQEREPAVIQVAGTGSVKTDPDMASMTYSVTGEGATADAASRALATKAKAIEAGLLNLLGRGTVVTTSNVNVAEVRGAECRTNYGEQRLSEGACAVIGYIASLRGAVETGAVGKVGTGTGLATRLGAQQAQMGGFALRDPAAAQARATQVAVRDAKAKATALAAAAGVRLGAILALNDGSGAGIEGDLVEIVNTGEFVAPPPPPPPPPPVEIDVKPAPIETSTRVSVRYAIQP
ncbi:SIMPL domain-containing protein [Sphingomonas carotinifaciens]|uniref:DUF541 domain-containing protein n=1 Tax=Sphingomonas carotinifaciens TaxID=1166323 RepID=A0A1G7ER68_9SPHN|nr:SIMPL domain-containing protein [Sphingomonas carotinifaciens]MBB4085718.1 hypothetical protein [Sphingomonas carotinifaciens]MWC45110.1 DUF541 domain-containing protein [Sphingomonas carotinifaciens]SDE66152.1 hypothetical protein SAMN05216557_10167 [Sphingomonas carotinifaciens]